MPQPRQLPVHLGVARAPSTLPLTLSLPREAFLSTWQSDKDAAHSALPGPGPRGGGPKPRPDVTGGSGVAPAGGELGAPRLTPRFLFPGRELVASPLRVNNVSMRPLGLWSGPGTSRC